MRFWVYSTFIFLLANLPANKAYANTPPGPDSSSTIHEHIIRNFAPFLYVAGQAQVGDLKYAFDVPAKSSHTSYDVKFSSVGVELGAGLRYKDIGLYLAGGYNFLTYWSGNHRITRTVQVNGTTKIYRDKLITEHEYPRNVLLGVIGLEYRIMLSPSVQCVPYVQGRLWQYADNRFYPKSYVEDKFFELRDNHSFGGGLALKGVLQNNSTVALRIGYLVNNFYPVGYFESLNAENLTISHHSVEISLTYEFDFSGYGVGIFNHQFSFY